jgi:hypothetical protein
MVLQGDQSTACAFAGNEVQIQNKARKTWDFIEPERST